MAWSWASAWDDAKRASASTHAETPDWESAGMPSRWSRSTDSNASPAWGGAWSSWGVSWSGSRSAIGPEAERSRQLAGAIAANSSPSTSVASSQWRANFWAGGASWTADSSAWGSLWSSWDPHCSSQESMCFDSSCVGSTLAGGTSREVDAPQAGSISLPASDLASISQEANQCTLGSLHVRSGDEEADGTKSNFALAEGSSAIAHGQRISTQRGCGRSLPPDVSGPSPVKLERASIQAKDPVIEQEFEVLFLGGQMVRVPKKKPGPSIGSVSGGSGRSKGSQSQGRRLLVSGLSSSTTVESLAAHFKTVGRILHASLVGGSASGRIEFTDEDGAQRAISELDGSFLDACKISVQMPSVTATARSKSVGGRFTVR